MQHIMYLSCQQREKDGAGKITITGPVVSARAVVLSNILN